ncbi:MAG: 4-(cytidine 5'-diphospho)-2-C-methyl-D-erythritol kinase, partial [Eubacterium sp.]|nr:4-(cytidine 5'-diphospho)-2-C-methyl-D-erythritol kinase [Eubacterium sp.]
MELKCRAKINLSLDVTGRREDGYHLVRMVMQMLELHDTLQIEKSEIPGIRLTTNRPGLVEPQNNLVYRAADMLMKEKGITEGLEIRLEKRIPAAAGLAGGSSDAAAAFLGVNEIFSLGFSAEELCERAVRLGADIPYCIMGGTMLAEGIGERLTALPPMPECVIALAKPDIDVPTPWCYKELDKAPITDHPDVSGQIEALKAQNLEGIVERFENVLEKVTISRYPLIREIKNYMTENGAAGTLMSGSGPTVFAVFRDKEQAENACRGLKECGLAKEVFVTRPYRN